MIYFWQNFFMKSDKKLCDNLIRIHLPYLVSSPQQWSCPRCSLINYSVCCEACGYNKNHIKKNSFESSTSKVVKNQPKVSNAAAGFFQNAQSFITDLVNDPVSHASTPVVPGYCVSEAEYKNKQFLISESTSQPFVNKIVNNNEDVTEVQSSNMQNLNKFNRQTSLKSLQVWENQKLEAEEKEAEILQFCRECKTNFIDDSFPPNKKSLTFTEIPYSKAIKWLRPKNLSRNNRLTWKIFCNPRPTDIIQGTLGNCWFLSALAVVCERLEILRKIMLTKEVNNEGLYQVRLNKDGKWVVVLVDDYLPCNIDDQLIFSQAERNQLWVPMIEKAAAKIAGCYEALIAGRCIEGLQMLTGSPCESIILHSKPSDLPEDSIDKDLIWMKLLSCRNAGYLMGASCGGDVAGEGVIESYRQVGLEAQHAYSLLDVQQIDNHRLLRLRNPWGRYSWTGPWSNQSPLWTTDLRSRLKAYDSDDGVFWISLEDMLFYFDCVDVCKYQPDWTEVTLDGMFGSPGKLGEVCHITVFAPTELNLTLFQKSNRGIQNESNATSDLFLGIYRCTSATSKPRLISYIAHSERKIKLSVICNAFLDEGVYLIVPTAFNHWNSDVSLSEPPSYVLSIHSSKPVLTDRIIMERYTYSDALFLLLEKLGKRHEGIAGVTCYYMSYKLAGLIVAAENRRSDNHLHVDCDCTNSYNVVSTRGSMQTNDCLPPLTRQILVVLTQLEGTVDYSVSHKLRFRLSPFNSYNGNGSHQQPPLINGLAEVHNPIPL